MRGPLDETTDEVLCLIFNFGTGIPDLKSLCQKPLLVDEPAKILITQVSKFKLFVK